MNDHDDDDEHFHRSLPRISVAVIIVLALYVMTMLPISYIVTYFFDVSSPPHFSVVDEHPD